MKIAEAIKGYILDCKVRGRSHRTVEWYDQKLNCVARWLSEEEEAQRLEQVTVAMLRGFVLHMQAAPVGRTTVNKAGEMSQISPLTVKGW
jgi:site-specific recombinase XerD